MKTEKDFFTHLPERYAELCRRAVKENPKPGSDRPVYKSDTVMFEGLSMTFNFPGLE